MINPKTSRRLINFTNTLMFETPGGQRFTQDSPILPNVWLAYALEPRKPQRLILTLHREKGGGKAAHELREMLTLLRRRRSFPFKKQRARLAYIPGQIAAELYFDEMMRVALPLTPWWRDAYSTLRMLQARFADRGDPADWKGFPQPADDRIQDLTDGLMCMRRQILEDRVMSPGADEPINAERMMSSDRKRYIRRVPVDLLWLFRIAGLIGNAFLKNLSLLDADDDLGRAVERDFLKRGLYLAESDESIPVQRNSDASNLRRDRAEISAAFSEIFRDWSDDRCQPDDFFIWRITQNRPVQLAVSKSSLTVKADAARRLFNVSCQGITWAVVDSGIDRDHPAFKDTTPAAEQRLRPTNGGAHGDDGVARMSLEIDDLPSRVVRTLDFTDLRELLDFEIRAYDDPAEERPLAPADEYVDLVDSVARRLVEPPDPEEGFDEADRWAQALEDAEDQIGRLRERISRQRDVDWEDLEPLIIDANPGSPPNDHGTHVAGILAADWIDNIQAERTLPLASRTRRMQGVCPDINLIDVRVFREDGMTDEFELLAAMQFLRWMNSRAGYMVCHGANLSLSLLHEVRRFACGQTPICDECNEAVALGMVVVAAAGNRGFEAEDLDRLVASDGYRPVSITDPGNAANVITVGATHRKRPHEYGVSYFSSRGPTGDGRSKPDLVAPGEKIKGPTPDGSEEFKDGTSMAAPHVSGAAAMLMARHSELVGQPLRVKQILCDTATDLKRERYFQGSGLLDILRALQSV